MKKREYDVVAKAVEPPIRVYWRAKEGDELSYDDAYTMEDAERMRDELIGADFIDVEIVVKGKDKV